MKTVKTLVASAAVLVTLQANLGTAGAVGRSKWVSGYAVIAAPEKYVGRTIAMLGFLANEREGFVLYLTPWHREFQDSDNAFLLVTEDAQMLREALRLSEKAVLVEATFLEQPKDNLFKIGGRLTELRLLVEAHSIHAEENAARKITNIAKAR